MRKPVACNTIYNGIMGSTGINYNSTKEWVKQWGIKQTINSRLGERFIAGMYADIVKNIKEYKPGYKCNTRVEWSLQYILK